MIGNDVFVAGIGSTNIDLLYSGVKKLPKEGEEVYSKDFSMQLGGGVPATLITLGRLGVKTRLATEMSDDIFSCFAKKEYEKNSVIPLNLYREGAPLNISSVMITPRDRTFMSYGKGNIEADGDTLQKAYDMCKGAKIVIMQVGKFLPVYKKLKEDGTTIVFDCGWDDGMSLEAYREYLEVADYYTPNQKEALKITDSKTPLEAAIKLSKFFDKAIVKLDKNGCMGMENNRAFCVPPIMEFNYVDSTGAGDAFLAGFIYGLLNEKNLHDSILCGNITGGKCITAVGCLKAYVEKDELEAYFEKYKNY